MARIVKHTESSPIEVKMEGGSKWICNCGLSKKQPYCDGSHKECASEIDGKTYKYKEDGTRTEVSE